MSSANFLHCLSNVLWMSALSCVESPEQWTLNIPNTNFFRKWRKSLGVSSLKGSLKVSTSLRGWLCLGFHFYLFPLAKISLWLCLIMFFAYMNHSCSYKTLFQFLFVLFPFLNTVGKPNSSGPVQAAHLCCLSLILRVFTFYVLVQ